MNAINFSFAFHYIISGLFVITISYGVKLYV
jgi:hypothetical protein